MDDRQIADTINRLDDVRERQQLRAHFAREGRSEAFQAALAEALGRQARKTSREETIMVPARWMARKAGGLVGRTLRNLERQAEKLEEEKKS